MRLPLFVALTLLASLSFSCSRDRELRGVGEIVDVDREHNRVRIRHDGIAGVMDATTLEVEAISPEVIASAQPRARVRFTIMEHGQQLQLVRLAQLDQGMPGMHDHTPHHDGVVAMVGMIHLEAVARADGLVRVYLTDVWRRRLPLNDIRGTITINRPPNKTTLPLKEVDGAMQAQGSPTDQPEINVRVDLERNDGPVDMTFQLPLRGNAAGAAGVPLDGCVPVPAPPGQLAPRCVLSLARPVTAIVSAPDASAVLIAAVDLGVSVWRVPEMTLLRSLAQPPPIPIPTDEGPHPEAINVLALAPDSTNVLVGIERQLLLFSLGSGAFAREIPWSGGVIRDAAWSRDGNLWVSSFYDATVRLIDPANGEQSRAIEVEREGAAIALNAAGTQIAAASEAGTITIAGLGGDNRDVHVAAGKQVANQMLFVDDRLIVAGQNGELSIWQAAGGALVARHSVGVALTRLLQLTPNRILVGTRDGALLLFQLAPLSKLMKLDWHQHRITGMARIGTTLVSADDSGKVALWDLRSIGN